MTTTWESLLSEIRIDIQDNTALVKSSDQTLYLFLKDAVRDYSRWVPQRVDRYGLTISGEYYPLPADFVDVVTVENPRDRYLEQYKGIPGRTFPQTGLPSLYYLSGNHLYLNGIARDGEGVFLTYLAIHAIPTDVDDIDFVFTIPEVDLELIRLYVKAKVYSQIRTKTANLDRFTPGSKRRDDNPIEPEVDHLMAEYKVKISERSAGGPVYLYRQGRVP